MSAPISSQIKCAICGNPVELGRDLYTDENGRVVHERCYMDRLMASRQDPPDPHHTE